MSWIGRTGPAALLAMSIVGTASAPAQVSLRTVVELAQRNSTAVRAARADVNKARAVLSETKDVFVPSAALSTGVPVFPEVGFTGQPPSIWSVEISSLVFSIPQRSYIAAARSGLEAAIARLKDTSEQVALDASSAYIELDAVEQELAAARQQESFAARLVNIEQQRAESGVDSMHDLLEAKLTAADEKLARIHLEARAARLSTELATLTGLPTVALLPDHASIPEIPQIHAEQRRTLPGITAANLIARSKQNLAKGDQEIDNLPQLSFSALYNRNTTLLNNYNSYFNKSIPANNFSSGIAISIPFDLGRRSKAQESAADALRATVEAEQIQRQNEVQIAELTSSLKELDAQAEVASLKQQIAADQLKTVQTELENGNGAEGQPGAPAQVSPKAGELAQIDERQKYQDAQEAGLELDKARLELLRALGHIQDWIDEVKAK